MRNLAMTYAQGGQIDKAIALGEKALAVSRKVMGPGHRETLDVAANLAQHFDLAGRAEEAARHRDEIARHTREAAAALAPDPGPTPSGRQIELLEDALELSSRVHGQDHPSTLRARERLAAAYRARGQKDKARALSVAPAGPPAEPAGVGQPAR
jgi:hypothetical protein